MTYEAKLNIKLASLWVILVADRITQLLSLLSGIHLVCCKVGMFISKTRYNTREEIIRAVGRSLLDIRTR
jgi:hypothetical protein